jgi:hypothetical protein
MSRMFHLDDYAILDVSYIVHAVPINPSAEHDDEEYLIGLVLHVGTQALQVAQMYPTRALRDQAFEQIQARVRTGVRKEDED